MSPYNSDSRFSVSSLSQLEEVAGISIMTALAENFTDVLSSIDAAKTVEASLRPTMNRADYAEFVICEWESDRSHLPPTWGSLLRVLKQLHLRDLSQQIEDYLLFGELCITILVGYNTE